MTSNSHAAPLARAGVGRPPVVYGAAGHTGRFVAAKLRRRGLPVILAGRDADKLQAAAGGAAGSEIRAASVADADALDRMLAGAAAVLNCAGPFADTAGPLINAAIRAGIAYFDVASEPQLIIDVFEQFHEPARQAGIVVAPGLAFFGGFGDLLATAAMGDWTAAESIDIAIALDRWNPTPATRATGQYNVGKRRFLVDGKLELLSNPPPTRDWTFPSPWGSQPTIGFPSGEVIMLARHLRVANIRSYINLTPIKDIRDPNTPPPAASDESGRSAQTFLIDVAVRQANGEERRAMAQGRDAYAVTAPILVEAVQRILDGRTAAAGAVAAGAIVDAREMLRTLSPQHFTLRLAD